MPDEPKKTFAAAFAAVWYEEQLLTLFREKWLSEGTPWIMPGGGVELGEEPDEALRRELNEEIDFQVGAEIGAGFYKAYKTEWTDHFYVFELKAKLYDIKSVRRDHSKFFGELWLPTDDRKFLQAIWPQLMPGLRMYLKDKLNLAWPE